MYLSLMSYGAISTSSTSVTTGYGTTGLRYVVVLIKLSRMCVVIEIAKPVQTCAAVFQTLTLSLRPVVITGQATPKYSTLIPISPSASTQV